MKRLSKQIQGRLMKESTIKNKEQSFDIRKTNDRRRTTTITKPPPRPVSIVRPINNNLMQQAKLSLKTNETEVKSVMSMVQNSNNTNTSSKNWIIRKSSSSKK